MDNGIRRLESCGGWPRPFPDSASACAHSTAPRKKSTRKAINGVRLLGGNTVRVFQAKASPVQ